MIKLRFASPEMLVDINNLPGLAYHESDADGTIRVGALCRHVDLERSATLADKQPTMASAAPLVADPIVRNRGTLVGSLCHADPQGDWASVMMSLDGQVVAQGPNGKRTIAVKDFVRGPLPERARRRRDRSRGDRSCPQGRACRRVPQAGAQGRRLRNRRRCRFHRSLRGQSDEGRNRAHRCRRVDDLGRRRRPGAGRASH